MNALEREWERQRRALLKQQRTADKELLLSYRRTYHRIESELQSFKAQLKLPITRAKLERMRQFETLLEDIERETWSWGRGQASEVMASSQRSSLAMVNDHTSSLVQAALSPAPKEALAKINTDFGRMDFRATSKYVGFASDGGPLANLLSDIAPHAKKRARDELLYGLVKGQNPRETARSFQKIASIPLDRALTISRTEILRPYRSAALESYELNKDVVVGWTWMAELSTRTCPACWARHGGEHEHGETFDSHPRCRCTPVPRTKSWAELGFPGIPEGDRIITPGWQRFANLSADDQLKVLGPGKYDLYKQGVPFENFASHSSSQRWGGMWREATVAEARTAA